MLFWALVPLLGLGITLGLFLDKVSHYLRLYDSKDEFRVPVEEKKEVELPAKTPHVDEKNENKIEQVV